MKTHFMLDIETTGIEFEENDIMQIGMLECIFEGSFWRPGRIYERFMPTSKSPTSEFAKKYMAPLYEKCNKLPAVWPWQVRVEMLEFFKSCGFNPGPEVCFLGWNASDFDVPFLVQKEILKRPGYQTINGLDVPVGDYNYRVYEMSGAVSLVQNILHFDDRQEVIDRSFAAYPQLEMPEGRGEHDAIYDCYKQLRQLNGLIYMGRYG